MTIDIYVARGMGTAGLYRVLPFKATGPSSYVSGGTAVESQLTLVPEVMPDLILHSGSAVRLAVYDYTNKKYMVYVPNTGAEVADGVDLSSFVGRGVAYGQ